MSWGQQQPYQMGPGYRAGPPPAHFGSQPPSNRGNYGVAQTYGSQPPPGQAGYGYAPPPYQGGYGTQPGLSGYGRPGGPPPGISNELWGWFQAVDTDRSGQITANELQQALHNGNWTPFNAETCRLMIGMFDRDRNGTINIQEFAALWKYIQDWKACFDRFDTDRSGNISATELASAFQSFGYNLSMNFVNVCMRTYDHHQRGSINFDDFIQCCVLLKSLTDQFRMKDTQQTGVVRIQYEEFLRMVLDTS